MQTCRAALSNHLVGEQQGLLQVTNCECEQTSGAHVLKVILGVLELAQHPPLCKRLQKRAHCTFMFAIALFCVLLLVGR